MSQKDYAYRLVRLDKPELVFRCDSSSLGAACGEVMQKENIKGTHRWANGYTVYIVDAGHIIGILVRD